MRLVLFGATPLMSVSLPNIVHPLHGYTGDKFRGYKQEDVQIISTRRAANMHRQQHCVSMLHLC